MDTPTPSSQKSESKSQPYRGALFKVEKPKNPASPQFSGFIQVGDLRYRLVGWVRQSKNGKDYLSVLLDSEPMPLRSGADADPFLR
jgi:uncharacterized protein (DUF736 family)